MIEPLIIILLIVISAFFSASETALTAISKARLYHLVKGGDRRAATATALRERNNDLIGTVLIGNNVVNIAAASLATSYAIAQWGPDWGPIYATLLMTYLVTIFAEILPKTIAINRAERVSLLLAYPLYASMRLLLPVTRATQWFIARMLRLFGMNYGEAHSLASASDVIRGTIELHHSEGEVEKRDRDMLGSILDLSDREISEVMLHRTNVYAIDIAEEPERIIERVIESPYSRIPLYRNSPDNIIGVLHVKNVFKLIRDQKIGLTREMIRRIAVKPWFVPDTTLLKDQLLAFRARRQHFACVVDEYGAYQGIVTLEDIIEEIVGDIDDEHDRLQVHNIIPFGPNGWRVDGTVTIRDLNRYLDWSLPDEHATTVAGLILHEAEMIPEQGAVFEFHGLRFTIAERRGNQIAQLIIEPVQAEDDEEW